MQPSLSPMLLITDLNDTFSLDQPCGLTIGSFDGVHLGHQALLKHLRAKLPPKALLAIFTFSNHPSHFFVPHAPISLITPPLQKVQLLENYGADIIFLVPFTDAFAKTSFEMFLTSLKRRLGFSHLALGSGATFGKNKEGNEVNVRRFAAELKVEVDYLHKYLVNGTPVSSGRIRTLISQGVFSEVQNCLGRPYSLMGRLIQQKDHYLLPFPGICLPPEGRYPIRLKTSAQTYQGIAHLACQKELIRLDIQEDRIPLDGKEAELIFASAEKRL